MFQLTDTLNIENYKQRFKEWAENLQKASTDECINIYTDIFDTLYRYMHETEKNQEIKTVVGTGDQSDTIQMFARGLAKLNFENAFNLIFPIAEEYFERAYYCIALEIYNIALSIATDDQAAKCTIAIALLYEEAGDYETALSFLQQKIVDPPNNINHKMQSSLNMMYAKIKLNNLFSNDTKKLEESDYLEKLESCEGRIKLAVHIDNQNIEALYIYAQILEKQTLHIQDVSQVNHLHHRAKKLLEKAIYACTNDNETISLILKANCHIALGKVFEELKEYTNAIKELEIAEYIFGKDTLNYPIYKSLVTDILLQVTSKTSGEKNKQGFSQEIDSILRSINMASLEKKYYENKTLRQNFVREKHRVKPSHYPKLYILQKWNSFTPILSNDTSPSRGGGYFITTGKMGIVFDPGFDFIQNFRNAGFYFNDIDNIFITHAHNDHTADLESLLSLLHDYISDIKGHRFSEKENCIYRKVMKKYPKEGEAFVNLQVEDAVAHSPRCKKLNIYLSPGAKEKCGFLKLGSTNEYKIVILNTAQSSLEQRSPKLLLETQGGIEFGYDRRHSMSVFPIPAKHYDLMTETDCYGFLVHFHSENTILWYTGDTGYSDELEQKFSSIKSRIKDYSIVLLAHIGGFKPEEQYYYRTNKSKAYYKHHLGRLGICKLLECLEPRVLLISEFGEEFKQCRQDLVNIIRDTYSKTLKNTCFFPADVGLILRFIGNSTAIKSPPQIEIFSEKTDSKKREFISVDYCTFRESENANEMVIEYIHKPA